MPKKKSLSKDEKNRLIDSLELEEFVPTCSSEWDDFKDDLFWFLAVKRHLRIEHDWKGKMKKRLIENDFLKHYSAATIRKLLSIKDRSEAHEKQEN